MITQNTQGEDGDGQEIAGGIGSSRQFGQDLVLVFYVDTSLGSARPLGYGLIIYKAYLGAQQYSKRVGSLG